MRWKWLWKKIQRYCTILNCQTYTHLQNRIFILFIQKFRLWHWKKRYKNDPRSRHETSIVHKLSCRSYWLTYLLTVDEEITGSYYVGSDLESKGLSEPVWSTVRNKGRLLLIKKSQKHVTLWTVYFPDYI